MAIALIFLLGIANFAIHKAVLESRHPLLGQMPLFFGLAGGRLTLLVEYAVLLGTMVMVSGGAADWGWGYAAYTAASGISAWLILSRRV